MELIVDLHVHSHYSRATSKDSNLEGLYKWGKIKGINVIGTGDFTHPGWFAELREKLEPAEPGLFKLKDSITSQIDSTLPSSVRNNLIRFILTVEISNIYSKNDKVRKLHNLLIAPSLQTVSHINARLEQIGNLKSDGRPILGLDSKLLLQITLDADPYAQFIPAHIWTPWFAMFGSKSGFNSITEAFDDLAPHIKIIETGLSSDPFMNWRLSQLDGITICSNSDAHSPQKLGREATILDTNLDYFQIIDALRSNDQRMIGTIEFFPEEGKYHYDGHRACNIKFTPQDTKAHNGICPVCGQPLTIGVEYRVSELADRNHQYTPANHKRVEYIIPLPEVLAELNNSKSTQGKAVQNWYHTTIAALGSEFDILRKIDTAQISSAGFEQLADAVHRMRNKQVFVDPGYDGVYGIIKVYKEHPTSKPTTNQLALDLE